VDSVCPSRGKRTRNTGKKFIEIHRSYNEFLRISTNFRFFMKKKNLFLIIDANALIHRVYHALPELTTPQGEPAHAVFGFINMLLKALREWGPTHIACAFDTPSPTFRHKAFPAYKATRAPTPDALSSQFPKIKAFVEAFGIPIFEKPGYEADDLIGTLVAKARKKAPDMDIRILTGDLDMLQLVDRRTHVLALRRGVSDVFEYNSVKVRERFGITPAQIIAYKTLVGDPSDNIPGVEGIGPKGAAEALSSFPSLVELLRAAGRTSPQETSNTQLAKIRAHLEKNPNHFTRTEKLIAIDRNVPIRFSLKDLSRKRPNTEALQNLFRSWGFQSLLNRISGNEKRAAEYGKASDRDAAIRAQIKEAEKSGLFSSEIATLERSLVPVIRSMERTGIRIDLVHLKKLRRDFNARLAVLKKEIWKLAGTQLNPNSPSQVRTALFETLHISPRGLKRTTQGAFSTGAPELEKIRSAHPIVEKILAYRELAKLLSTYVETLPKLIDPTTHRIHTTFRQLGTETGRISSADPNLQNVPARTALGRAVRDSFVAEKGFVLVSADYSQIELRVVAHLSGDSRLQESFHKGEDIHRWTAAEVYGVPIGSVSPKMRAAAKALNFGILYGMGPRRFAQESGLSIEEALGFLDRYKARFPGVVRYLEETLIRARQTLFVETFFGRRRMLPEIVSKNPRLRSAAERAAMNMPVQGTAADVVKKAMVSVAHVIGGKRLPARMLLQVHDELLFEVSEKESEAFAKEAAELMEGVVKFDVPLVVITKIARRWGEMVE